MTTSILRNAVKLKADKVTIFFHGIPAGKIHMITRIYRRNKEPIRKSGRYTAHRFTLKDQLEIQS